MPVNIESTEYRPDYRVELKHRTVQHTPETTAITQQYWVSNYGKHKEVMRILTGGVNINDFKQRSYPKVDPYFQQCYCFDADAHPVQPDAFSDGDGLQPAEARPAITAFDDAPGTRYAPVLWTAPQQPNCGCIINASYRNIRAPYRDGNLDFDCANPEFSFAGKLVSIDSYKLGWRYDDNPPEWLRRTTGNPGNVTEAVLGFSISRIYVPNWQFARLSKAVIPFTLGKINLLPFGWTEAAGWTNLQNGQEALYYFPAECMRFDNVRSMPHHDVYGNVYWTVIFDFSVIFNIGGPRSGHEGAPIGWNALFNPNIDVAGGTNSAGWMRVSTAPNWLDYGALANLWLNTHMAFNIPGLELGPDRDDSLYIATGAFPELFRMAE